MNNATVRSQLIAAKALIATPEKWCQNVAHSRDRMCAVAAICQVDGGDNRAYETLCDVVGGSVVNFNDSHTHEEVMVAFDKAIAVCVEGETP